jgi:hypothetical protein
LSLGVKYPAMFSESDFLGLFLLAMCGFAVCVGFLVKSCFDKERKRAIVLAVLSAFILMWAMGFLRGSIATIIRYR